MYNFQKIKKSILYSVLALLLTALGLAIFIGISLEMPIHEIFYMIIYIVAFFALVIGALFLVIKGHYKRLENVFKKGNIMKSLFILMLTNWAIYFIINLIQKQSILEGIVVVSISSLGFLFLHLLLKWNKTQKQSNTSFLKKVIYVFWAIIVTISFVAAGYGLLRIFIIDIEAVFSEVGGSLLSLFEKLA